MVGSSIKTQGKSPGIRGDKTFHLDILVGGWTGVSKSKSSRTRVGQGKQMYFDLSPSVQRRLRALSNSWDYICLGPWKEATVYLKVES